MTTRSIVTSQPDVECDVCERRLLRGEQPDFFLAAGRRRIVCELCAPRAAHEGWMRETDQGQLALPTMRPRRGRSFFDRLRQSARPAPGEGSSRSRPIPAAGQPYDLFGDGDNAQPPTEASYEESGQDMQAPPAAPSPPSHLQQALDIFNAGEYPRRMAGVARSLGAPVVSVRSSEHLATIVRIVVAWELCWYRYDIDLGDPDGLAEAVGQGTEVDELEPEEREGNAVAGESGMLALAQ